MKGIDVVIRENERRSDIAEYLGRQDLREHRAIERRKAPACNKWFTRPKNHKGFRKAIRKSDVTLAALPEPKS